MSKKNVQIIIWKYIMTNIDTQETDYSVYSMLGRGSLLHFAANKITIRSLTHFSSECTSLSVYTKTDENDEIPDVR